MRVAVALLGAGSSTRLGTDKIVASLGGKPVWSWAYGTYVHHPDVDAVFVVASQSNCSTIAATGATTILGGASREESARKALDFAREWDALLFHDAARPFVDAETVSRTIAAIRLTGAAAACIPVKDTIREVSDHLTKALDRSRLVAMQTPQGALVAHWIRAFEHSDGSSTDDVCLLEQAGISCDLVTGTDANFKITTMEDLRTARLRVQAAGVRVGTGYDVHAFSNEPDRPLMLGGLRFEGARGLEGHSDADVLLHAICDAILGAAALGDIGQHFPNTDDRWKNAPSTEFLSAVQQLVQSDGFSIVHVDATLIAEAPKVMIRAQEIRQTIAQFLQIEINQVSVKATTNERLGFVGRSEGIAAIATATLSAI